MTQANLSSQVTVSADPVLNQFMREKLNSLAKWDLVQYFHCNPGMITTAPRIASQTGRDLKSVEKELKEMVASGLIEVKNVSGVQVYQLSTNKSVRLMVTKFITACDDRSFRQEAIYQTVARH